jgi:hypothetical protein
MQRTAHVQFDGSVENNFVRRRITATLTGGFSRLVDNCLPLIRLRSRYRLHKGREFIRIQLAVMIPICPSDRCRLLQDVARCNACAGGRGSGCIYSLHMYGLSCFPPFRI